MSSGPENTEMYVESAGLPTSRDTDDQSQPNPKFLVRYSRQSLENTNVRNEDSEFQEYQPSQRADRSPSMPSSRDSSPTKSRVLHSPEKENQMSKVEHKEYDKDYLSTENQSGHVSSSSQRFQDSCNVATDHVDSCSVTGEHKARHAKKERDVSHNEANLDDQYMSKQMYLYLTHKELKRQIEDLARRELHACTKQCWDEALRLRDMRNRLELSREKELYNMENLDLDEADRKLGLASIDKREEKLSQRENACTDTTMYSEDAKALWKKWMHEDDDSLLQDARAQRELLMTKLEKEWQGLAICDKERVMRTFENVLTGCSLQDEHKLTATMSATRAKSALNRR